MIEHHWDAHSLLHAREQGLARLRRGTERQIERRAETAQGAACATQRRCKSQPQPSISCYQKIEQTWPVFLAGRTETVRMKRLQLHPLSPVAASRKRPFKSGGVDSGQAPHERRTSAPPERARGRSLLKQVLTVTPGRLRSPPHRTRARVASGCHPVSHETSRSARSMGTGQTACLHRGRWSHRSARRR